MANFRILKPIEAVNGHVVRSYSRDDDKYIGKLALTPQNSFKPTEKKDEIITRGSSLDYDSLRLDSMLTKAHLEMRKKWR